MASQVPELGAFLRTQREAKNLRQVDVAEALGVVVQTVMRWEAGLYMPPARSAAQLEQLYGLTPGVVAQIGLVEQQLAEVRALAERERRLEAMLVELQESVPPPVEVPARQRSAR